MLATPLQDLVNLGIGVDELQLFGGVHLDGSETGVLLFQSSLAHIGGTVAADPGVDPDGIPARARP